MLVDTNKIEWLLENRTQYFISRETNITQSKLSGIKNKRIKIENLTIRIGSELTDLAVKEMNSTQE